MLTKKNIDNIDTLQNFDNTNSLNTNLKVSSNEAWQSWYLQRESGPSEKHKQTYTDLLTFLQDKKCTKVLELGCGQGVLMHLFEELLPTSNVIGIDITKTSLITAKENNKKNASTLDFCCGSATLLPFKDNSFDAVIVTDVLHHLVGKSRSESKKNVLITLNEITRITKNNSFVLIWDILVKYKLYSYLIFYLTSICSKFNIEIPSLQIHKEIIVSFLTSKELESMLNKTKIQEISKEEDKINFPYLKTYRYIFRGMIKY